MPLLVLDLSVYQTRPLLLSGLNLFYHSHLPGNLTINGLWYAYLQSILSDTICRMGVGFRLRFFGVTKVSGFKSPCSAETSIGSRSTTCTLCLWTLLPHTHFSMHPHNAADLRELNLKKFVAGQH